MSKYKVGDKVRIRADLKIGKEYGNLEFLSCMADFKGKILTVKGVNATRLYGNCYTFEEDNKNILGLRFSFSEEMLEPAEKGNSMSKFDWEAFKKEKIAVHCDTEKKAKAFLRECDKHGIKWLTGDNATDFTNWKIYESETCFEHYGFKALTFSDCSYFKSRDYKIVEYLFAESTEYPEIHITTDGKITTAIKLLNGKEIARGVARCHPDDKFDFDLGAYVALEHLNNPFKPYLCYTDGSNMTCGNIGDRINATTAGGDIIHVGDTVEVYDLLTKKTIKQAIYKICYVTKKLSFVYINSISEAEYEKGYCVKFNKVITRIIKPYTELKNGELIGDEIKVKAVTKEG